jgi:hypothetical protein
MLMTKERRPAIRTLRGWAIGALQDAGAVHECEEHGWMRERGDPHARDPRLRPREPAAGSLATGGCRGGRRSARFDRRHLPGMSAWRGRRPLNARRQT